MTVWFPALRDLLARKLGPHLPPHPLRILAGSVLTALAAWVIIATASLVYSGVSAVWRAADTAVTALLTPPPEPTPPSEPAPSPPVKVPPPPKPEAPPAPRLTDPVTVREPVAPDALPFREARDAPLDDAIRQADFALIQTLARLGLDRSRLSLLSSRLVNPPEDADRPRRFQRIRLFLNGPAADFAAALQENLEAWAERASLETVSPTNLRLLVDGKPSHELFLTLPGDVFVPPPAADEPRLTIVIDDLGANVPAAKALLELDLPITFSIIPSTSHAAETARLAARAGQEVLIHQPMEAMQAPFIKAGPGALTLAMTPEAMRRTLERHVAALPEATGLNNHMGSRLTRDAAASRLVAEEADRAGLLILDSLTHPASVLHDTARDYGLTAFRRDVFLDDGSPGVQSVRRMLEQAERTAKAKGRAIAIGHPRPETLAALKEWAHDRDGSVALVPLRYQGY